MLLTIALTGSLPFLYNSCTGGMSSSSSTGSLTSASSAAPPAAIVAGNGGNVTGTGALSVPTADGVVLRLQNGMQGNVSATAGNFAKALALLKPNMPQVTDPTKATGFDQVQLLAYAACSDLTTGTTPKMQSNYNVNPKGTIASNVSALIAAGTLMLDQYTGGMASQGPTSTQVQAAFTNLVNTLASTSTNTSTIAFISVCIAANTTGSTLLGF